MDCGGMETIKRQTSTA